MIMPGRCACADAGLLAAARLSALRISRYGTLRTRAEELGHTDAASLLQETLDEEEATDQALTEIAKTAVNSGSRSRGLCTAIALRFNP